MTLFKTLVYKLLGLQEKVLRYRLSKTIGVKHTSKRKQHYADGCTLSLSSLADAEKEQLEAELTNILKAYDYNPQRILEYVKAQGTDVVFAKDASKVLNPIGETEGFIYPAHGSKALYLSLGINRKFSLKTNEMFVLSTGEINKYYFLYHLYNWFAFKHNIAGMDSESQELLKKYLFTNSDTKELQLEEIFKLKDAIKQDKASIEFVIKLCRNYDGAKQALDKLQNGGAKL